MKNMPRQSDAITMCFISVYEYLIFSRQCPLYHPSRELIQAKAKEKWLSNNFTHFKVDWYHLLPPISCICGSFNCHGFTYWRYISQLGQESNLWPQIPKAVTQIQVTCLQATHNDPNLTQLSALGNKELQFRVFIKWGSLQYFLCSAYMKCNTHISI